MNLDDQADAFYIELSNLINRFTDEFDLNLYTIVGVMDAKKMEVMMDVGLQMEDEFEEDDDQEQEFWLQIRRHISDFIEK